MEQGMSDDTQMQKAQTAQIQDRDKYAPADFTQLMKYGEVVVNSGLCPDHIKKPEDAVLIVQRGQELGLSPMQALQGMHVVKGKVGLDADTMKAVVEASGLCERWHYEEHTDEECQLSVKRKGREPVDFRWTLADAKKKDIAGSHVWKKYPRQMLRHRADAEAARAVFPDLLNGLYTPEELHGIPERDASSSQGASAQDVFGSGESGQPDDVIDVEPEEGPIDFSGDDEWRRQNERFHALMNEAGISDSRTDEVREAFKIKVREADGIDTDAEKWKHISPPVLGRFCDKIEGKSAEPQKDGPPERSNWAAGFVKD